MTDQGPDMGLYFACNPPILVPLSDRAKAKLKWTEFADGVMFLDAAPEQVLGLFPEDWVVVVLDEFSGDTIKLMSIKVLH